MTNNVLDLTIVVLLLEAEQKLFEMHSRRASVSDDLPTQPPPSYDKCIRVLKQPNRTKVLRQDSKPTHDTCVTKQAWSKPSVIQDKNEKNEGVDNTRLKKFGKCFAVAGFVLLAVVVIVLVVLLLVGNSDPVAGGYSSWSDWTACSVTCDQGQHTRSRSCSDPEPAHGGEECVGPAEEIQDCIIQECQLCEFYVINGVQGEGTIFTVAANGTVDQLEIPVTNQAQGLVLDKAINTFFWTEKAQREDTTTDVLLMTWDVNTDSITQIPFPSTFRYHLYQITNDPHEQWLFILLSHPWFHVVRLNYNGGDLAVLHVVTERADRNRAGGIDVDVIAKYVYWTQQTSESDSSLQRCDYNGQDHSVLLQGEGDDQVGARPTMVVVDNESDKIYWILFSNGEIRSTSLSSPGTVIVEAVGFGRDGNRLGNTMAYCYGEFYTKRRNDYLRKWDSSSQTFVRFSDVVFNSGQGQLVVKRLP